MDLDRRFTTAEKKKRRVDASFSEDESMSDSRSVTSLPYGTARVRFSPVRRKFYH